MSDQQSADAISAAMLDIGLVRSTLEMSQGGVRAAIDRFSKEDCDRDLLLVQSDCDEAELRTELEELSAHVASGTQVVLVGRVDSIEFYRSIIDLGIGQYVLAPLTPQGFMRAVKDVFGAERAVARGRTIAVVGAKGGVGASTLAHNLAWSLSAMYGKPVSLVDLDLHFGTAGIDYNHETRFGLRDALSQVVGMGSIDETLLERLFSKETDTLWLLASMPSMQDSTSLMTPDALQAVVDAVARMSDFVVLDVPHVWNPTTGAALLMADEVVIVSEPSLQGLRNTQLMFESIGPGKPQGTFLRYVLTNSGLDKASEIAAKEFSEAVGSAPLLTMPWLPAAFRAAGNHGRMIADGKANAKAAASFTALAKSVSGPETAVPGAVAKKPASKPGKGFMASLRRGKGKKDAGA